ncbi:hypothetical protein [Lapidilactobacillus bayanensis]|uniref:hypothetical protein n=1 Tax=Lapidilactobacillus bayanensis TaxID=2485998 RepID=UPI000F77F2E5|nr:hypothetical protein [Lapidilactobacillus bayanensis]
MWQLLKKEFKLQPWALFSLLFCAMLLFLFVPTYRSELSLYAYDRAHPFSEQTKPTTVAQTGAYYANIEIEEATQILDKDGSSHWSIFPLENPQHQSWRNLVKRFIAGLKDKNYRAVNRILYEANYQHPEFSDKEVVLFNYMARSGYDEKHIILNHFIKYNLNTTYVVGNTDILPALISYFGGGLFMRSTDEKDVSTKRLTLIVVICSQIARTN